MTVSKYTPPNRTTQDGTTYPFAIDASMNVLRETGAIFAVHETSTPSSSVIIDPGRIQSTSTVISAVSAVVSFTFPVSNARIDRVMINRLDATATVIVGNASTIPSAPSFNHVVYTPIAQVYISSGATFISNEDITDERVPILDWSIPFYKYGTFTPHIVDLSLNTSEGQTYGTRTGFYIKIGNFVYIQGYMVITSLGSLSGNLFLYNLPFSGLGSTGHGGVGNIYLTQGGTITAGVSIFMKVLDGASRAQLLQYSSTTGAVPVTTSDLGGTNPTIYYTCVYMGA